MSKVTHTGQAAWIRRMLDLIHPRAGSAVRDRDDDGHDFRFRDLDQHPICRCGASPASLAASRACPYATCLAGEWD